MASNNKTHDKDKGFQRIKEEYSKLKKKPHVKVGLLSSGEKHKQADGLNVVTLASYHEFGSKDKRKLPERSFLRSTFDEKNKNWHQMTNSLKDKIHQGSMTVEKSLDVMGMKLENDVKMKIRNRIPPKLKASTIERKTIQGKKGDIPLIDTGQLINSIKYKKVMND